MTTLQVDSERFARASSVPATGVGFNERMTAVKWIPGKWEWPRWFLRIKLELKIGLEVFLDQEFGSFLTKNRYYGQHHSQLCSLSQHLFVGDVAHHQFLLATHSFSCQLVRRYGFIRPNCSLQICSHSRAHQSQIETTNLELKTYHFVYLSSSLFSSLCPSFISVTSRSASHSIYSLLFLPSSDHLSPFSFNLVLWEFDQGI